MRSPLSRLPGHVRLGGLKRDHPVFQTTDFNWDVWGYGKRLHLNGTRHECGGGWQFQVTPLTMTPGFHHTGTWYDFFSGEHCRGDRLEASWDFEPGEYHLWTDVALETPGNILAIHEAQHPATFQVVPNPTPPPFVGAGNRPLLPRAVWRCLT